MYTGILKDVAIVGLSVGFLVGGACRFRKANALGEEGKKDAKSKEFQCIIAGPLGFTVGSALFYGMDFYAAWSAGQYMNMLYVASATSLVGVATAAVGPYLIEAIHMQTKRHTDICNPRPCNFMIVLSSLGVAISAVTALATGHAVAGRC